MQGPVQETRNLGRGSGEKITSRRRRRRLNPMSCLFLIIGVILAILVIAGLTLNWLASFHDQPQPTFGSPSQNTASVPTPTATPCPSLATDSNITIKQIPEGEALVVNVEDVAFQVVALFNNRGDLDCWAYGKDLLSKAHYAGPALVVLEEDPNPSQSTDPRAGPARPEGTFALIIGIGGKVDATVTTIPQAKSTISKYPDRKKVTEKANYPITTGDNPA